MIKLNRSSTPAWLQTLWFKLGIKFQINRLKNPGFKFQWAQVNGMDTAELLRVDLLTMSNHHCCFCDAHPMESMIEDTIEHFKPKSKYPLEAYAWENLFIACPTCQKKKEKFNYKLLKPDAPNYNFNKYFIYNALTGEVEPNPGADWENQERAWETIFLYKLNDYGRPATRKNMRKVWGKALSEGDVQLDECPYRFMFL
jgi:uncharacterized protein (TIGR02646 family)